MNRREFLCTSALSALPLISEQPVKVTVPTLWLSPPWRNRRKPSQCIAYLVGSEPFIVRVKRRQGGKVEDLADLSKVWRLYTVLVYGEAINNAVITGAVQCRTWDEFGDVCAKLRAGKPWSMKLS